MKKLLATLLITSTLITPCLALTPTECQQIQQTAHRMAECARQLGYSEDSVIIQEAQKKWLEAFNAEQAISSDVFVWDGPVLTKGKGVNMGPSGKETYYNLNMSGVVRIMRGMGFSEAEYPYWVREDGAKMLGPYVMVAANLRVHPRGSVVECSLGRALVCDTGGFARSNPYQLDIAVSWK